ncbi:MAG TPA: hypothetical protein VMT38_04260 [Terracidiphilus sp.]|nr:hypothetical protein [Terracidiphilus sp.]
MPQNKARTFKTTARVDVPTGRHGKHREIVNRILNDLEGLDGGTALKIPLDELKDTKTNVRSALSRATRKIGKSVGTATDDDYLYVWNL